MKQVLLLVIAWVSAILPLAAQTPQSFTLEQCISYALESSIEIKNASLDEQIATARVKETTGIGLPQVDGTVSIQHNQKLRRFFGQTPSPFIGPGINTDLDNAPDGTVFGSENPFQLKSSGDAGVTINQILFSGSYLVGLRAANSYKELSNKTMEQTKEQTISSVSKAFYLALTNQERVKLFDANLARVDSLLRTTKALNQSGFAERIDVDRIQVTYNNLATERQKFLNLQLVAIELLKFQMNYPMNEPILLSGSLADIGIPDLQTYSDQLDYSNRWDYQLMRTNIRLLELDLKNKYASGIPSLVAFANLGYATGSANIGGVFRTDADIADMNGIGPDKWYGYSLFGVTLNVPLFSGLQRNYRVQQSKLNLRKLDNASKKLESAIDLEIKQSRIVLDNALRTIASQKENMDLAANVARVTKVKYEQGVGSNLEVIEAESSLREAQINYYNALYDALVAKVDIDKAYGKLNPVIQN
jgi:outer membrane protein TolC